MNKLQQQESVCGLIAGLTAFVLWGLLAIYWRQLEGVSAYEILAYRVIFSFIILLPVIWFFHRWNEVRLALGSWKTVWRMLCSTLLIAINWGTYIWAVNAGQILETSLGYHMNPLMNMAVGCLLFGERASVCQKLAFCLAGGGVLLAIVNYGSLPWIALALSVSFTLYGVIRKTVTVEALPGLFVETLLLSPLALFWVFWQTEQGQGFMMSPTWGIGLLLFGTGVVTTVPLCLFAYAARHIALISLGFIQFISPTMSFAIGALLYDEPVTSARLMMFGAIWSALVLQMFDAWRTYRMLAVKR